MAFPAGVDANSYYTMDQYQGYGTAFNNPSRFILDMSKRIHLLNPNATPFLSWMTMLGKGSCHNIQYSWMEDELFTARDIKGTLINADPGGTEDTFALKIEKTQDWHAFEAAAREDAADVATKLYPLHMIIRKADGSGVPTAWGILHPAIDKGKTSRSIGSTPGIDAGINMIALEEDGTLGGEVS